MTHRVGVLDQELCQPKKCGLECIKYCPVNKSGSDCIILNEESESQEQVTDIDNYDGNEDEELIKIKKTKSIWFKSCSL